MGDAVSHEELVAIVRTNYQKTQEEFCDLRQSIAADAEELDEKITELKSLLLQSTGFKLPGPTDAAGVASTLETAEQAGRCCKRVWGRMEYLTISAIDLRIYWWERGLKPEIAAEIKVDPLTYKGYTDIEKAQQAACAYGAHYDPSPSAASRKRDRPVSSSDTDSGADQALTRGQSMHRLHNATVASASDEINSDSDERLAMLFEGSFGCGGHDGYRVDTSILFDSGATSNFVSPRLLKRLAVNYNPSSATLRLADASSVPILGRARLCFKLQSFSCTVTCYVTDLCDEFDLILGNSFMAGQKRRKGALTPATGANTIPLPATQHSADAGTSTSLPGTQHSAGAGTSTEQSGNIDCPSIAVDDFPLIDNLVEGYAADPFFANADRTVGLTFAQDLWWKRDRIVVPDSSDTKKIILQAFHDHPWLDTSAPRASEFLETRLCSAGATCCASSLLTLSRRGEIVTW
ncbi:MAG: hypothetical protein FRX49_05538 [Trebouxia sp. A1-2]|nr:MAG: hypothetical protein FRX49_05538 [Trebouxia sp. A1-2]